MENGKPNSSEPPSHSFVKISHLNCIDLSSPDIRNSVSLLKQASLDCGFFYVINHGISQEFINEVFDQSKRFFSLPMSEKMKLLRNEKHRGYTPVLDELLDHENQVNGDYKEGYYLGVEVPEDDPKSQKPFYGPNVWPAADILPGWRQTMEKYHQEALKVARVVARIIAVALDLEADFFDKPEMLGEPIAVLRLLHYEGQISDPSKGFYGAGAHSDYGLITLLATDDIMGLQICKDKDARPQVWEYVAPLKGSSRQGKMDGGRSSYTERASHVRHEAHPGRRIMPTALARRQNPRVQRANEIITQLGEYALDFNRADELWGELERIKEAQLGVVQKELDALFTMYNLECIYISARVTRDSADEDHLRRLGPEMNLIRTAQDSLDYLQPRQF